MIARFFRKLGLYFNPPKEGEAYVGDPDYFVSNNQIERILHSLKDKFGNDIYEPIPSKNCYRLMIVSESSLDSRHYVCATEVLCKSVPEKDGDMGSWKTRTQLRRLPKVYFKDLVVNGLLKKEKV
jgi:hypothetical protein